LGRAFSALLFVACATQGAALGFGWAAPLALRIRVHWRSLAVVAFGWRWRSSIPSGIRMKISVVIPAFNEEKLLASSLERVKDSMTVFSDRNWGGELIVCDNNSTDQTVAIARAHGAIVVFEPVNQISRARNRGASVAQGDWLLFVDADSWPTKELFEAMAARIDSGRIIGGGCTIQLDGGSWGIRAVAGLWNRVSRVCRWAAGSFVFCGAADFHAVGGFSEALYASEEIDLSKKLKARGRATGRRFVIIAEVSLRTSSRRAKLYSLGEHLRFVARLLRSPRASLARREGCQMWYDGRR
jgi:GT2 family glycosyltransferase